MLPQSKTTPHSYLQTILGETLAGDFSSFEDLTDSEKGMIASEWTKDIKHRYLNRHSVISEEEFFAELDKIANGTFEKSDT